MPTSDVHSASGAAQPAVRLCYFTNVFPAPSHTTMRREIDALEALGVHVLRVAARRFSGPLVDPADLSEAKRTRYTTDSIAHALIETLRVALTRPLRFARAVHDALSIGPSTRAGLWKHLLYVGEAAVLLKLCRGCDHIHANFGNATSIATLCRVLGGPPVSLRIHGPEELETFSAKDWEWKACQAAFLAPISRYGAARLRALLARQHHGKIRVHRCGVDAALLCQAAAPVVASPRIACVARLEPRKGHKVLLEALARLHADGLPATLLLVGDGSSRPALEALARELSLSDAVQFAGWQPGREVARCIASARVFVLPSFAEGLPIVLMESLALGRAVIASAVDGIPELVLPGRTGWLVPPDDVTALAAALRDALTRSDAELRALGRAGQELVRGQHDAARLMEALRDDVLASGAVRSRAAGR